MRRRGVPSRIHREQRDQGQESENQRQECAHKFSPMLANSVHQPCHDDREHRPVSRCRTAWFRPSGETIDWWCGPENRTSTGFRGASRREGNSVIPAKRLPLTLRGDRSLRDDMEKLLFYRTELIDNIEHHVDEKKGKCSQRSASFSMIRRSTS